MRVVFAAALLVCGMAQAADRDFNGRWDISVSGDPHAGAWWLEVTGADTTAPKGKFIGAPGGQLDEIPKLSISDGEMRFSFERRYHRELKKPEQGLYWARLERGKLKGTFEIAGDPESYLEWIGVRAPSLPDKDDGAWRKNETVSLFNGHDLNGWTSDGSAKTTGWTVRDGVLTASGAGSNLVSNQKFWNFLLHAEFRIPPHGNSGIGLRGRYEVQILDDSGRPPSPHGMGSIYSRIAPVLNASKDPGDWQTFDIRLIGRQVTITLNGVRVIDRQPIDGLTAIAIDANEGDPGPIVLQGDHGPVEFRKLTVYPLLPAPPGTAAAIAAAKKVPVRAVEHGLLKQSH